MICLLGGEVESIENITYRDFQNLTNSRKILLKKRHGNFFNKFQRNLKLVKCRYKNFLKTMNHFKNNMHFLYPFKIMLSFEIRKAQQRDVGRYQFKLSNLQNLLKVILYQKLMNKITVHIFLF